MKQKYYLIFILFLSTIIAIYASKKSESLKLNSEEVENINRMQYEHGMSPWVKESYLNENIRFWRSDFEHELVNAITFSNMDENSAKQEIDKHIKNAKDNNYSLTWWVSPSSKPNNLDQLLIKSGFKILMQCECMVKYLNEPIIATLPEGVEIKLVTTQEQMKDYVDIVATSFEYNTPMKEKYLSTLIKRDLPNNPKVEQYIAYFNNQPVCTGLILIIDDKTTTFYDFATLPSARKKGIGTAMMLYRLKRSQELGAKRAVIIAAPDAQNINKKVGFEKSFDLDIYVYKNN